VGGAAVGRAALWRDGLALVADYPFTGSGLGSTMMALSSYVLLLHVGFISHMHNLFLQIAIEQGIVGLIAWAALLSVAAWRLLRSRGRAPSVWLAASLASLTALIVYGMVDVGPYASRLAPVMFLPIGCALAAARTDPPHPALPETNARSAGAAPAAGLALALIAVLALGLLPGTRAAFQANLGALAQTRAELAVYHWPDTPLQDALRRPVAFSTVSDIDLGRAIERYRAALALNPANAAANRRLGQIELSRGQYAEAQTHLAAANAAAPAQRATRQLLAEAYAIGGEIERAVPLLRTVDLSQGQISLRTWWYDALGETANAEAVRAAAEEASR
jgi:tetratricopeptide (TPR) repeat protein